MKEAGRQQRTDLTSQVSGLYGAVRRGPHPERILYCGLAPQYVRLNPQGSSAWAPGPSRTFGFTGVRRESWDQRGFPVTARNPLLYPPLLDDAAAGLAELGHQSMPVVSGCPGDQVGCLGSVFLELPSRPKRQRAPAAMRQIRAAGAAALPVRSPKKARIPDRAARCRSGRPWPRPRSAISRPRRCSRNSPEPGESQAAANGGYRVPCDPQAVTVCHSHEAAAPGQARSGVRRLLSRPDRSRRGERHSVLRLQSPLSSSGSAAAT